MSDGQRYYPRRAPPGTPRRWWVLRAGDVERARAEAAGFLRAHEAFSAIVGDLPDLDHWFAQPPATWWQCDVHEAWTIRIAFEPAEAAVIAAATDRGTAIPGSCGKPAVYQFATGALVGGPCLRPPAHEGLCVPFIDTYVPAVPTANRE